jgi:hypothetical protein
MNKKQLRQLNFFCFMGLRLASLGGATLRGSLTLGPAASGGSAR